MPHYLNVDQLGTLDPSALDLRLRSFSGYEELSRLYQFRLDLDLPVDKLASFAATRVIGKPIVFSINEATASPSFFSGVVSSMSFGNKLINQRRVIHVQVVPELWKLTQMLNTKRFDSLPVYSITNQLIQEFSLDLNLINNASTANDDHPPRVDPVMYDESPFNYLARLLAEESVFYYFLYPFQSQSGAVTGKQEMVIGDAPSGYTPIQSPFPSHPLNMRFQPTSNAQTMDMITDWARQYHFRPASWTIQDYDYEKSHDFNMLKSAIGSTKSAPAPYKKFKRAAGFKDTGFATSQLDRRGEHEAAQSEFVRGESYCHGFHPGISFQFSDHEFTSENGNYVVTSVEHHAIDETTSDRSVQVYENTFTCVPASQLAVECPYGTSKTVPGSVQFSGFGIDADSFAIDGSTPRPNQAGRRPRLERPSPQTRSVPAFYENRAPETAFVCDHNGDYSPSSANYGTVQTDSQDGYGRVLIRFPWEADDPYQANRWVRVAQTTAGKDWGGKFLPRVGDEVIVMYIDGREQRPMIVGTVYNDVHSLNNQQESKIYQLQSQETDPFASTGLGELAVSTAEDELIADVSSATNSSNEKRVPSLQDPNVSGFRTRTNRNPQPGDDTSIGYNELLFNDTPSNQQIYIRAEKDLNIFVKNNLNVEVCGNKNEIIRGDYFRVTNVGASPNGYVTDPARRYPEHSDGGVGRSITNGDNYDYDKVWQVWTVETFADRGATSRLGSSHGQTHTENVKSGLAPKYYLVKTETYADQQSLNVGDTKEMFKGNFEEHFHGHKLEVVKGSVSDSTPTIQTEITGYTHETFDGKTETTFKGEYVKTTFDNADVEEYYLGSNVFSFHAGAKEEIMIGLVTSLFLGGAFELFVGNKMEIFAGNLVSLHAGSKVEVAPDHRKVNAKWTAYATSFGVAALAVKMNGLSISLN